MRAWRVHELGEPGDVMVLDDIEAPVAGPGEVLLDVGAASLNFPDVLMCRGKYQEKPKLPFIVGGEVAGTVAGLGEGATGFEIGQRVLALTRTGGLCDRAVANAAVTFPIPDSLELAPAAALHIVYQTGHIGLHRRAGLRAGETLLVHAGAGGVGSAAIQLGVAAGARVIATAGGAQKVGVCRELGAEVAIDYLEDDFVAAVKQATENRGADVIYDPVGGDVFDRSLKCIAWEGRLLVIGFASGRIAELPTNRALLKNCSVVGVNWGMYNLMNPELIRRTHDDLMALHEAGKIAPLVSEVLAMTQARSAAQRLADRGTVGKIVIDTTGTSTGATTGPVD
jgi:NADPH2:quinone reductase